MDPHLLIERMKQRLFKGLLLIACLLSMAAVLYLLVAYHFSYSKGESVGYVQKLSYKGWLCKTWEGEQLRSIVTMQAIPEKFFFTVRDDAVAEKINQTIGQKVVMVYDEHPGLPGCFGDTTHFVVDVQPAPQEPLPANAAQEPTRPSH